MGKEENFNRPGDEHHSDLKIEKIGLEGVENELLMKAKKEASEKGFFDSIDVNMVKPKDNYYIVYIIFLMHGIAVLMPWNMFINANDYFTKFKLRNLDEQISGNGTTMNITTTSKPETAVDTYRSFFLNFLGVVSQTPNVIINLTNVLSQRKSGKSGNNHLRIVISLIIITLLFITTIIFAMVDSSSWQSEFFWITMVTVVIMNLASGLYQNCVYGLAAILPMRYTNAVIIGTSISGITAAVLNLIAMMSAPNPRTSAMFYFLAAIFVLLLAFDTYFLVQMLPFYCYYQKLSDKGTELVEEKKEKDENIEKRVSQWPPYLKVLRQCWRHCLGVYLVYFVTLSCFPALQSSIGRYSDTFWISEYYYNAIACFLIFNVCAGLGNFASEFFKWPKPKFIIIPIVMRLAFIPFFMFCNARPDGIRNNLPVVFNDYVYILGSIGMSFSSGYYASLSMMYAPRDVDVQHKGLAGMMAAFCLILGIFSGVLFSFPLSYIVKYA